MSQAIANLSDSKRKFKKCHSFVAALVFMVTDGRVIYDGDPTNLGDWTPRVGNLPRATNIPPPPGANTGGTINIAAYMKPSPAARHEAGELAILQ